LKREIIKTLLKIGFVLTSNLLYYFTKVKDLTLNYYFSIYNLFLSYFELKKENNNFYDLEKDYYLVFDYSCTTIPFYLFIFSILLLINKKLSIKKINYILLTTESINFGRIILLFFVYDKLNLSYNEFWFFHLVLSVFFLILLFSVIWKIIN